MGGRLLRELQDVLQQTVIIDDLLQRAIGVGLGNGKYGRAAAGLFARRSGGSLGHGAAQLPEPALEVAKHGNGEILTGSSGV